ncbi:hypothetical protein PAMP_004215 [Pampus punctatissimus]
MDEKNKLILKDRSVGTEAGAGAAQRRTAGREKRGHHGLRFVLIPGHLPGRGRQDSEGLRPLTSTQPPLSLPPVTGCHQQTAQVLSDLSPPPQSSLLLTRVNPAPPPSSPRLLVSSLPATLYLWRSSVMSDNSV